MVTSSFDVAAPRLCLDFVNTEGLDRNSPPDRLDSLGAFLDWATSRGLLDEARAGALPSAGDSATADFLAGAREVREALYRIFSSVASEGEASDGDLELLGRHLADALPSLRLERRGDTFEWALPPGAPLPEALLWPIVLSAADLLRSDRLERVKECAGDTCSWMFIDTSRNRSRRWCDMSDCGNRAKARRFYRKHKKA